MEVKEKKSKKEILKENVIVGRLIPAGTGTVLRALRKVAAQNDKEIQTLKAEEEQEKAKLKEEKAQAKLEAPQETPAE